MKALVFKSPWEIALEDRDIREPGSGEALIKVIATGVCGSDLHGYAGHTGRRHPNQVMGHETVGRIEVLTSDSSELFPGQVVVVNPAMSCGSCYACADSEEQRCENLQVLGVIPQWDAAFAEFMVVPIGNLIPLPEGTPEYLGALAEPLTVGWHAVRRAGIRVEEPIVVIGGGPIGQAVALAAARAGVHQVIVSEGMESRRGLLHNLGFTAVAPDELDEYLVGQKIKIRTVFDAVGSSASVAQGLALTERGGKLVLIGMAEPRLDVSGFEISVKEREFVGTFCYSREDFISTVEWLGKNIPTVELLVDAVEPLASGPQVFHELASYSREASKILLSPTV